MFLKFLHLVHHNFLSYQDEVFYFNNLPGITRVTGHNLDDKEQSNGSGKSALFEALPYVLYGELPYNLKNENIGNKYLPNDVKDRDTQVILFFENSKNTYKIISGLKKRQSYCELYELQENGEYKDITRGSIAETRKYIIKNILGGCDLNLFMRTVYLNSDKIFNFYNLTKSEREEFFDKLFGVDIITRMYDKIHTDKRDYDKKVQSFDCKLLDYNKNNDTYTRKENEWNSEHELSIDNKKKEYEKISGDYKVQNYDLTEKKKKVIQPDTQLNNKLRKEFDKLKEERTKLICKQTKISSDITSINSNISSYEIIKKTNQRSIDNYSKIYSKLCEDCQPKFAKYYKIDDYQNNIEKFDTKIKNETTRKCDLENELSSISSDISSYSSKILSVQQDYKNNNNDYFKQQKEIEKDQKQVDELYINLNRLSTELEILSKSTNPYTSLREDNSKELNTISVEREEIVDEQKHLALAQEIVDPKNIKKVMIRDFKKVLNETLNRYLKAFNQKYSVIFDDDLIPEFFTSTGERMEYNNFSQGEQARISIATCFTFIDFLTLRNNLISNILIIDEFFDSNIDAKAMKDAMRILRSRVQDINQHIYVVSHHSEIDDDLFDHIIQVEKKNHISKINVLR